MLRVELATACVIEIRSRARPSLSLLLFVISLVLALDSRPRASFPCPVSKGCGHFRHGRVPVASPGFSTQNALCCHSPAHDNPGDTKRKPPLPPRTKWSRHTWCPGFVADPPNVKRSLPASVHVTHDPLFCPRYPAGHAAPSRPRPLARSSTVFPPLHFRIGNHEPTDLAKHAQRTRTHSHSHSHSYSISHIHTCHNRQGRQFRHGAKSCFLLPVSLSSISLPTFSS